MKFFFYGLDKPWLWLYSMRKSILSFAIQANQIFSIFRIPKSASDEAKYFPKKQCKTKQKGGVNDS